MDDIRDRSTRLLKLAEAKDIEGFTQDDALHEAILRHLTIIGEAVKGLPSDLREVEPQIPWRKIARLRDLLVHVYFGVKDEIIWQIVENDVPALKQAVERLLASMGEEDQS